MFVKRCETQTMRIECRQNTGGTLQLLRISSCYLQERTSQKTLRLYYSDLWVNAGYGSSVWYSEYQTQYAVDTVYVPISFCQCT